MLQFVRFFIEHLCLTSSLEPEPEPSEPEPSEPEPSKLEPSEPESHRVGAPAPPK
jgi:hypothetical protein